MLRRLVEFEIPIKADAPDAQRQALVRLRQRAYRAAQKMWHNVPANDRAKVRENIEKRLCE